MSHLEKEHVQQLQQEYQRAEADKQELIAQRERKEKEIRGLKLQRQNMDLPFNPMYTEATVHGLTVCLREARDGSDDEKNANAAVAAGRLCTYVQQRCDEDHQLPLVDVPACLEQAKKDANFCGKEFRFSKEKLGAMGIVIVRDSRVTDELLRTIPPLLVEAQKLIISGGQVTNLTPLAALTGLRELSFTNNEVMDLTPLAALTNLQVLGLENTRVADVRPLVVLIGLQQLILSNTQVANVAPLAALTGLQQLILSNTQVADVAPLAALTGLRGLLLGETNVPRDDAVVRELRERGVEILM